MTTVPAARDFAWPLTLCRLVTGSTILTMATHHVLTWPWFKQFIHERFDPVFGLFIGPSLAHSLLEVSMRVQTAIEFALATMLLIGHRLPLAASGAALLYLSNLGALTLEELINPGQAHAQRMQVLIWNHVQLVLALGALHLAGGAEMRTRVLHLLRLATGGQVLLPALWCAYLRVARPFDFFSTQTGYLLPALAWTFPLIVATLLAGALALLVGWRLRPACATIVGALLFVNSQFLLKPESREGYSVYFAQMPLCDLVYILMAELALLAALAPGDSPPTERPAARS